MLHTFGTVEDGGVANYGGANPASGLLLGPDGAFYGTTTYGGAHARGVIYRLSPDGVFSVLHDINATTDGWDAYRLIAAPDGKLYGVMSDGGALGGGTVFRIGTDGVFAADSVLAKHDENYMPKEVADGLKAKGVWQETTDE